MSKLVLPADRTLREHRDALLTPTEYLVATKGPRHARNKRGRGSTDLRALVIGEMVEIDECKISLVMAAKTGGFWERMSRDERDALETLEEHIRSRFWILVMIDVASRMPLAWVIAETPGAEATLELLRMATRDKTREKLLYGCTGEPAAAVGLMHVKNDNGTGLRNSTVVGALMGTGSINTITRTYASTDRAHIERFFGRLEMDVFKLLPGYTGRGPGELPGYDAMANGVLTVEELHGIVSRYLIDEYPSTRHHGVGMGGRRPSEVYRTINETRGQIPPIDPHIRRIQLGWQDEVTPTDEGVRVFSGVWFNSTDLQRKREEYGVKGKVKVYVDPDDMNLATVVLPMAPEPIEVRLQITAFADMTLPEILRLMAEQRREDPETAAFHDDRVMRTRLERHAQIEAIGVEHDLPRSYSTVEECQAMGKAVFSGAHVVRSAPLAGTTAPGDLTNLTPSDGVYRLGSHDGLIDGTAEEIDAVDTPDDEGRGFPETSALAATDASDPATEIPVPSRTGPSSRKETVSPSVLARPKNLKELE